MQYLRLVAAGTALVCWAAHSCLTYADVEIVLPSGKWKKEVLMLECIEGGVHRLGTGGRMFLIEDRWEFDRCKLLFPDLSKLQFNLDSLLVVLGWDIRKRSFEAVRAEDGVLVIEIKQASPPMAATSLGPPKFQFLQLPTWPGPVRFEINSKEHFTLLRGKALDDHVDQLWDEILRVHSGGHPHISRLLGYYRKLWGEDVSDAEIRSKVIQLRKHRRPINLRAVYPELFHELIDLRAKTAVPRIFALIEAMGKHDKAFEPAWKTLVAIGGPEVVAGCRQALSSWNHQSCKAAILILKDLGLPETRDVAYAHLAGPHIHLARGALGLLNRIGLEKRDVPFLLQSVQEFESKMFDPSRNEPLIGFDGASSEDISSLIYAIGTLGSEASDAVPALEQIASRPRFPLSKTLQKAAQDSLSKIRPR